MVNAVYGYIVHQEEIIPVRYFMNLCNVVDTDKSSARRELCQGVGVLNERTSTIR